MLLCAWDGVGVGHSGLAALMGESSMASEPDEARPDSRGWAARACEVTLSNVTDISFHPHSAFLPFSLSPLTSPSRDGRVGEGDRRPAGPL